MSIANIIETEQHFEQVTTKLFSIKLVKDSPNPVPDKYNKRCKIFQMLLQYNKTAVLLETTIKLLIIQKAYVLKIKF